MVKGELMKSLLFTLLLLTSNSYADERADVAKSFMKALKKELMSGMSKGPKAGLIHCNDKAMPITNSFNNDKYEVGRVSFKVRNPSNAPSNDFKKILAEYSDSSAKNPAKPKVVVLSNKDEVFVKPLYMKGACLSCHGTNISSAVKEELTKRYPNDKATGYKLGEFRGLVWVKKK